MYKGELTRFTPRGVRRRSHISHSITQVLKEMVRLDKYKMEDEREAMSVATDNAFKLALPELDEEDTPQLALGNFKVECLIGFGGFGKVWIATYNKKSVALKQHNACSVTTFTRIWKERDVLLRVQHPRICKLFGVFYDCDIFFVLELCYGGLTAFRNKIDHRNGVRFALHLLQAVEWIHSKNIIHADIKPDNCLINSKNNLVVSDFGSAQILEKDQEYIFCSETVGTYGYMDYAATKYRRYSISTDMFGVAATIFEMDTKGCLLFYRHLNPPNAAAYVNAFKRGRVIGFKGTFLGDLDNRETLKNRCTASCFGDVLQEMIRADINFTPRDAMIHPTIRFLMAEMNITFANIDRDSAYVTRDFNHDLETPFEILADKNQRRLSNQLKLSLLSLYYDNLGALFSSPSSEKLLPIKIRRKRKLTSKPTYSEKNHHNSSSEPQEVL